MDECNIGEHDYHPRYDKSEPIGIDDPTSILFWGGNLNELEKFRRVTYVRDVCTKCGKTIERERK